MQIKAKIKVARNWGWMNMEQRKLFLVAKLDDLAAKIPCTDQEVKTIRNKNGNTTHIEVKI